METLTSLIDWYSTAKRLAGRSERTLELARRAVAAFSEYLGDKEVEAVTRQDAVDFLTEYRNTHAASSAATTRAYLSSFWRWAVAEGLVARDVMAGVPVPVIPDTEPHVVSDEEFAGLLRASAGTGFLERRDTAIIRLLESTGCRRSEIAFAELDGLDLASQSLSVVGKGKRPRRVSFDDETSNALRHYLRLRSRQRHAGTPRLFIGGFGALSPDAIGDVVTGRARRAGIWVTAHAFRHRFGHTMKAAGMSEESLRSLGGWSSSKYLEQYGKANRASRAAVEYQGIRRRS